MQWWADERGDVIIAGVLRLVGGLLLVGFVLFEGGALLINRVQLDEAARVAASVGARAWTAEHTSAAVTSAVEQRMAAHTGMALEGVTVENDRVAVTVSRPAPVLLLDHIPLLAHHANGRATSRSAAGSS